MTETANDSFRVFPYRSDYEDGRTNNGGIDLVHEPERIAEVTELEKSDALKAFVLRMNSPNSPYLTLGCDYENLDDGGHGYVEFATRHFGRIEHSGLSHLPDSFADWMASRGLDRERLARYVTWETDWYQHRNRDADGAQRLKLTFYYRGRPADEAEQVLGALQAFLFPGESLPEQ
ncbi:hypothetical protein GCM10022421_08630 [Oceanisphaera sediminis]|uniref:Uncharacterized protein n=1 Tax=Oceanisphaera sediminis TaxID=981381 RepID=A0ABP7DH38_9GAMM